MSNTDVKGRRKLYKGGLAHLVAVLVEPDIENVGNSFFRGITL